MLTPVSFLSRLVSFPTRSHGVVYRVISTHCTLMLTVAVLLARLGSGVSAMVAAFSVITVPAGAVTFTVSRTVHVVFGAMLPFSWQTICPVPWYGGCRARAQPRRAGDADVVEGCSCRHLCVQHFVIGVVWARGSRPERHR